MFVHQMIVPRINIKTTCNNDNEGLYGFFVTIAEDPVLVYPGIPATLNL